MKITKILLSLLLFTAAASAHQYTGLDDLVTDVCSVHAFDSCSDPVADTDGDGVADDVDNCPSTANAGQEDADTDGIGDACEPDSDSDGVIDDSDQCHGTPAGATVDAVGCEVIAPPVGNFFESAPVNEWVRIPNTPMSSVLPPEAYQPPATQPPGQGHSGSVDKIIGAWSGGAWAESVREMHIPYGGGHANYCGNLHVSFNADTLSWTLLKAPTTDFTGFDYVNGTIEMADGSPNSRQTYGGVVYNKATNSLLMLGGSLCSGGGKAANDRWELGLDGSYDYKGGGTTWSLGWQTVYDDLNNRVIAVKKVVHYELSSDWTLTKLAPGAWGNTGTIESGIAIDSNRQKILVMGAPVGGSGTAHTIDLIANTRSNVAASLPSDIVNCVGPGLSFSPSLDRFIGWCGGDIYLINPVDLSFTIQTPTGDIPSKTPNGVYGRFAWSESLGGIIYVDGVDSDVAFLKF